MVSYYTLRFVQRQQPSRTQTDRSNEYLTRFYAFFALPLKRVLSRKKKILYNERYYEIRVNDMPSSLQRSLYKKYHSLETYIQYTVRAYTVNTNWYCVLRLFFVKHAAAGKYVYEWVIKNPVQLYTFTEEYGFIL